MTIVICDELADIILQMKNGDQPWAKGILPIYKTPLLMMESLLHSNREAIEDIIGLLRADSNSRSVQHVDYQPYISIMLSYAYCISNENQQSLSHAKTAVDQFNRSSEQWDRAMAHWFLGIVYKLNESTEESKIELRNAIMLLKEHFTVAQRKNNHETSHLCRGHINKIEESIKKMQNLKTNLQSRSKFVVSIEIFSGIVERLIIDREINYLEGFRNAVINLDATSLPSIKLLMTQIDERIQQTLDSPTENAILRALLSHCYNIGYHAGWRHIQEAEACVTDAIGQFRSQNDEYNQAISHWYLALLYQNFSNTKDSLLHLNEADHLFRKLIEEYQDTDFYDEIQNLLNAIQSWINPIKPQSTTQQDRPAQKSLQKHEIESSRIKAKFFFWQKPSKPMPPETTSYPKKSSDVRQVQLPPQGPGEKTPPGVPPPKVGAKSPAGHNNEPEVEHIIIPVDLRALKDQNPKLNPLDFDLFKKLHQYEEKIIHNNGENGIQSAPKTNRRKPISIPGFPLYGQVAAGPNGEPNLDPSDLEIMEEVKDDVYINLEGQKHEVMFVNNEQFNFAYGKRYGWLKVIGQSMNNSSPIPVNDGDYVLFSENRDANSCLYKIVVARLLEVYNQPPQLVVKRLLRDEKSLPEYPEFVLHSESLLEEDPRTGRSYKEDIPVVSDNQIAGEVIAIAKPI